MSTSIALDSVTLDIDPIELVITTGRRGVVMPLIDGTTIVQDRGYNVGDTTIQCNGVLWGNTKLQALYTLYRKLNHQIHYTDYKGNDMMVQFEPGPEAFRVAAIRGSDQGYEYAFMLRAVSITKLIGANFPSNI